MEERSIINLIAGLSILLLNTVIWIYLLIEILLTPLPVNCDGAWPENTPILVFATIILISMLLYVKKRTSALSEHIILLGLLDIMFLFILIMLTGVRALCICYAPSIIYNTYLEAAILYVSDSAIKSIIFFSPAEGERKRKRKNI